MKRAAPGRPAGPVIASGHHITLADLQKRTEPEGECLLWTGYVDGVGSAQWRIAGKLYLVRRLLWELTRGTVPKKHQVGVRCGIPACVHPDHLVSRTRGSVQRGVPKSPMQILRTAMAHRAKASTKLTVESAADIRTGAETVSEAARRHGISVSRASRIRRGQAWRDYSNPFAGLLAR